MKNKQEFTEELVLQIATRFYRVGDVSFVIDNMDTIVGDAERIAKSFNRSLKTNRL